VLLADSIAAATSCAWCRLRRDGATACAVALRGPEAAGARNLDYLVPTGL